MSTTTIPCPFSRIHQLADAWVERQPDAIALEDAHSALTYGQLVDQSIALQQRLIALGVRAGDRVMIIGENCVAACVAVLALSRLDAWSSFINARLSAREVDEYIQHADSRCVLFTCQASDDARQHAERHAAQALGLTGDSLFISPVRVQATAETVMASAAEQVAALVYTSGTSGTPKGVMLTHGNLLFAANASRENRGIKPGERVYGVLPMAHVVGLAIQFLGTLAGGATLILDARFSAERTLEQFKNKSITIFTGVPAIYAKLIDYTKTAHVQVHLPALRCLNTAGAPLSLSLKNQVESTFKLTLNNGYGLTEASPTISRTTEIDVRSDCSVGHPVPGTEVRLINADGVVAPGEVGELWVKGPHIMKGYYRNEATTREVLDADGWFNTGDMARQGDDHALHIVGRSKELIIRSGFNVYPPEVEQVINSHPGVLQSAVVGRTVDDNEEVVAFVELRTHEAVAEPELRAYLRERLSPYKVPSEIRFMPQLPCAATGKILKNELKHTAQSTVSR